MTDDKLVELVVDACNIKGYGLGLRKIAKKTGLSMRDARKGVRMAVEIGCLEVRHSALGFRAFALT